MQTIFVGSTGASSLACDSGILATVSDPDAGPFFAGRVVNVPLIVSCPAIVSIQPNFGIPLCSKRQYFILNVTSLLRMVWNMTEVFPPVQPRNFRAAQNKPKLEVGI